MIMGVYKSESMGALGRCVLHEISPISIKLGQFEGLPKTQAID